MIRIFKLTAIVFALFSLQVFQASAQTPVVYQNENLELIDRLINASTSTGQPAAEVTELSAEELDALFEEAEELTEPESSRTPGIRGSILSFLNSFNAFRLFTNQQRLANMGGNSAVIGDHLENILFMQLITHPTELVLGPATVGYAISHNWPGWAIATVTAGAFIIAIPTGVLDPLCLIANTCYARFSGFRSAVNRVRYSIVYWPKRASNKIGLTRFLRSFVSYQDRIERIQEIASEMEPGQPYLLDLNQETHDSQDEKLQFFDENGELAAEFYIVKSDERRFLKKAVFLQNGLSLSKVRKNDGNIFAQHWKRLTRKLKLAKTMGTMGFNPTEAVLHAIRKTNKNDLERLANHVHVREVRDYRESTGRVEIDFNQNAVNVGDRASIPLIGQLLTSIKDVCVLALNSKN